MIWPYIVIITIVVIALVSVAIILVMKKNKKDDPPPNYIAIPTYPLVSDALGNTYNMQWNYNGLILLPLSGNMIVGNMAVGKVGLIKYNYEAKYLLSNGTTFMHPNIPSLDYAITFSSYPTDWYFVLTPNGNDFNLFVRSDLDIQVSVGVDPDTKTLFATGMTPAIFKFSRDYPFVNSWYGKKELI